MPDMNKSFQLALDWVQNRLTKKRKRAEQAYVNAKRQKVTTNCKHCGPPIGDKVYGCKLLAMGTNGLDASVCHNLKAQFCPMFELPKTLDQFKQEFRQMPAAELALRWPAVGELIKIEQVLSSVQDGITIEGEDERIL